MVIIIRKRTVKPLEEALLIIYTRFESFSYNARRVGYGTDHAEGT